MKFNKYYQDELSSLRNMGLEFARRNPGLAPFLATPGRDPDVERILEGFAFLTGRLRQKLDDELPEITHALFNLLWPNYLRPVPSCSIIQYEMEPGATGTQVIPAGTQVRSNPVEGTSCSFKAVYDVEVSPVKLRHLSVEEKEGLAVLVLTFDSLEETVANLNFNNLKFFFAGEMNLATSLYFQLLKKTETIKVTCFDSEGIDRPFIIMGPEMLRPVGFREDEYILPYPSNTFPGYRLLQEFFCFMEKFLFVELSGLDNFSKKLPEKFKAEKSFQIQFWLSDFPEHAELFNKDHIKLFCTPVVNLFDFDGAPLLVDHHQTECRIVPDPKRPYHFAVYSVNRVSSWLHSSKSDVEYEPFESFEHGKGVGTGEVPSYYRLRIRPALHDTATETYISIIHPGAAAEMPHAETISLELTCTNRLLPRKLELGDICLPDDNTPGFVTFKNIVPVTDSYAPPLGEDLPWRLISNMSLNYISLINIQALKSVIRAYDFRALHDKRRARVLEQTLRGMIEVESVSLDRIYRGMPLRGSKTTLTLDQSCFTSEGAMYLFGSIINEFLALYATVNSFHQLAVVEKKCGERYQWPARLGAMNI